MGMIKELKESAMRGSVVDMAVGIIIGSAVSQSTQGASKSVEDATKSLPFGK